MEATVISPLAGEILDRHAEAEKAKEQARQAIEGAIGTARDCGTLVETAKAELGRNFQRFWRDEVKLPKDTAKAYLTIKKLEARPTDKAQLKLAGILEDNKQEGQQTARPQDPLDWTKHLTKAMEKFNPDRFKDMGETNREATKATVVRFRDQLNDLIEKL